MEIRIFAVGKKMPDWVETGTATYLKRIPRDFHLSITEISQSRDTDRLRRVNDEGEALLKKVKPSDIVIALDVRGKSVSTEVLAENLNRWQVDSTAVCFLVGGPEGLSPACITRANLRWSLSALTLPHPLVRVLLTEQLYRAHTILTRHPYHRA